MGVTVVCLGVLAGGCSGSAPLTDAAPSSRTTAPAVSEPGVSWLRVMPQEGLRNATVSLDVACLEPLGPVHSPVLDVVALQPDPAGHQPWHLTGTATVHADAAPGPYPISASCGADQLTATFTVVPHP